MATPDPTPQASCLDDFDPDALPVETGLARVLAGVAPVEAVERIALRASLGRVLAAPVLAPFDVPAHANSAMDGYAARIADLDAGTPLAVAGTALAGRPYVGSVGPGQCVRIMTGAVMPAGADTVVPQEITRAEGAGIVATAPVRRGDHVREAGEDIRAGGTVFAPGRRIRAADLGLLASLGCAEVPVRRRLRVAFFSTGDELRSIGEALGTGDIYDSNRYTLYGMLTELGCEVVDMGVVGDDPALLKPAFVRAADCADVVITSGGVSVGEADYVKAMLAEVGRIQFWKVAMKPGRPLAFGHIGNAVFFGLPGNPVSVMVTFELFVEPALRRMMGELPRPQLTVRATSTSRLRKRPGRIEYQRGVLEQREDGTYAVRKTGAQGSGILSSMSEGNCYIVLPMESTGVEAGALVDVRPFDAGL